MTTAPTKSTVIPTLIPESYKKAMQENSALLKQLFGVDSKAILDASIKGASPVDQEVFKTVLHFLDVYIEIFDYSAKQQNYGPLGNRVVQECIKKFREIWRQGFRRSQYLTEKKLEQIWEKVKLEILLKLSSFQEKNAEIEATLEEIVSLDLSWIRRINEYKRNKDFELIQVEAVDKFKTTVVTEFPYLFDEDEKGNNLRYCEDDCFGRKLEKIIKNCMDGFKEEISFEEEETEDVLKAVLERFIIRLEENVIQDLKLRNNSKKTVTREHMVSIVGKCVEKYKNSITSILGVERENKLVQFETETISALHKRFVNEFTPKWIVTENGMEIGTQEYQVKCLNLYESTTHEILRDLVKNLNENCEKNMLTCRQEAKDEIQACLEKVTEIFGRYGGMSRYSNALQSQFENGLDSIFGQVKEDIQINNDHLLTATKSAHQKNEETQYKNLIKMCKKTYSEKLFSSLQASSKYPHFVDNVLLDNCHQNAITSAIALIRSTNTCSLPTYLTSKKESKFVAYVNFFITLAKGNLKGFIGHISGMLYTYIPFHAVKGTDFEIKNSVACHLSTQYSASQS